MPLQRLALSSLLRHGTPNIRSCGFRRKLLIFGVVSNSPSLATSSNRVWTGVLFFRASVFTHLKLTFSSLSATILRRRIVGAMQCKDTQKAAQLATQVTIYNNASIERLAAFLVAIVADPDNFVLTSSRTEAIELMIAKYSDGLSTPIAVGKKVAGQGNDDVVALLTGSTGNLGSQILDSLLRNPKVKTVYALNRPSSSSKSIQERHVQRFLDRGLDSSLLSTDRLVFLEGEASHRNLGLKPEVYKQVRGYHSCQNLFLKLNF